MTGHHWVNWKLDGSEQSGPFFAASQEKAAQLIP